MSDEPDGVERREAAGCMGLSGSYLVAPLPVCETTPLADLVACELFGTWVGAAVGSSTSDAPPAVNCPIPRAEADFHQARPAAAGTSGARDEALIPVNSPNEFVEQST